MRRILIIVAILMALMGLIWTLQGINLLAGSPMTGDPFWARTGAIVFVAGVVLGLVAVFMNRSPRA